MTADADDMSTAPPVRPVHGPPVVRRAAASDVTAVRALVTAAYAHYVSRIGRRPRPMDADHAGAVADGAVDVVVVGDRVIVLRVQPDHMFVENVAVAPGWQGRGVGVRLLDLADERARDLGLPEVRLYTHELMTENIAFYARRGFAETGRRTDAGRSRVYFSRSVTPGHSGR